MFCYAAGVADHSNNHRGQRVLRRPLQVGEVDRLHLDDICSTNNSGSTRSSSSSSSSSTNEERKAHNQNKSGENALIVLEKKNWLRHRTSEQELQTSTPPPPPKKRLQTNNNRVHLFFPHLWCQGSPLAVALSASLLSLFKSNNASVTVSTCQRNCLYLWLWCLYPPLAMSV